MTDLLIKKIKQDLKSIEKKDYRIEIIHLNRTILQTPQLIECLNSIVYVFFAKSTFTGSIPNTTYLRAKEKIKKINDTDESYTKFVSNIKTDDYLSELKFAIVRLIR